MAVNGALIIPVTVRAVDPTGVRAIGRPIIHGSTCACREHRHLICQNQTGPSKCDATPSHDPGDPVGGEG